MELNKQTSSIIKTFVLAAILIFLGVFATQTIGLFKSGLTENWDKFIFYIIFPGAALLGIILLFIVELVIKKGDETYGNSLAFNSPEEDPHISKFFNWMKSPFKILIFSLILFSLMGLYVAFTKQSFIGVGRLTQQFTLVDNLIFSTLLVAISENLGAAFWATLTIFSLRFYARKNNWTKGNFNVLMWVSVIFIYTIYGILNHYSRYGNSDIAIMSVAIFWGIGGVLCMTFGSIIPFLIMHMSNNFFLDISEAFSNDIIILWSIIVIISFILVFTFISTRKNKNPELVKI